MKVNATIFLLLLSFLSLTTYAKSNTIVPKPLKFETREGQFTLSDQTRLISDNNLSFNGRDYLQKQLLLNAGYTLKQASSPENSTICFNYDVTFDEEAYTLDIAADKIVIRAGSQSGFFYATISLMQLMDPSIWSQTQMNIPKKSWDIPACYIKDQPRFRWRGLMLDSARHFFSKAYVKKFIDRMAQHKLNLFHWHLSDDEGWRIEIKAYPLLTKVGAERGPGTALPFSFYPTMRGSKEKVQKGYYTQEDVKEIVAYAAKRSVRVLPEIDVPAHAKAAVVSYPLLLQDPHDTSRYISVQKVRNNTIDPGVESSYTFIENVIEELTVLFPFQYIHLGGDEIPKGAWQHSPSVAKLMQKEHLKEMYEVEAYFFTRMDKILAKHNRKMIAWQEVRKENNTLRDDTLIMAWRGDGAGVKAAMERHQVIMAPAQYLYFDQQYIKKADEPGHTWAGPTDTRELYSYRPASALHDPQKLQYIRGVHACLWSERLFSEELADYMTWPRALALSEIAWSTDKARQWSEFKARAFTDGLKRLEYQNIHYRAPMP